MKPVMQDEQSETENKRFTPRWNLQGDCACEMNNGSTVREGHLKDVSCAGVCLETDKNFPVNQNVDLTLHLPNGGVVNVCGKSVWTKAVNSHFEIGFHFFNTSGETQDTILQHAAHSNRELLTDHWFEGWKGK